MTKSAGSDGLGYAVDDSNTMMSASAASIVARQTRLLHEASHELRQPLQAAYLLHERLAQRPEWDEAEPLLARMATALGALSGRLNHLVDAQEIEFGTFEPTPSVMPISRLLGTVLGEMGYEAQAREVVVRVIPSRRLVVTDPRLLAHILRSLAWRAITQTASGKVLVGCRRRGDQIDVEVWYGRPRLRPLDSQHRRRPRGTEVLPPSGGEESLSSVLAIAERFALPLERNLTSASVVLRVSLPGYTPTAQATPKSASVGGAGERPGVSLRNARIMVVEDNPYVREAIASSLGAVGHQIISAASGNEALAVVRDEEIPPDILLLDYNLPGAMTGLEVAATIRTYLGSPLPTLILTGNTSGAARAAISTSGFARIDKPVSLLELRQRIDDILGDADMPLDDQAPATNTLEGHDGVTIYVVDDDWHIRRSLGAVLEAEHYQVEAFESGEAFLDRAEFAGRSCLIVDAYLPQMSGLAVLERLKERGCAMASIVVTGHADIGMAVRAMQSGASEFIEKPIATPELLRGVRKAILRSQDSHSKTLRREAAIERLARLTPKQRSILDRLLEGQLSKIIAHEFSISQRTVEHHRAKIMARTGTRSLPELARLQLEASGR